MILVTGAAGFIGSHLCRRLVHRGDLVIGLDYFCNDRSESDKLKRDRLAQIGSHFKFRFEELNITDYSAIAQLLSEEPIDVVVHLAASAGVRRSLTHPHSYVDANLLGFVNILEGCRHNRVCHLIYASSSSVYGANTELPYATDQKTDHPVSLYAATKKANELMAYTYSHLYQLPTTGLRFFTVYGPWGRPDMAMSLFAKAILNDRPINVFNHGKMKRDFTYIDDAVEYILRLLNKTPTDDPPYKIYNIGSQKSIQLDHLIELLEKHLGKKAIQNRLSMQPGDVLETWADLTNLSADVGLVHTTSIEVGIKAFVDWYRNYHKQ